MPTRSDYSVERSTITNVPIAISLLLLTATAIGSSALIAAISAADLVVLMTETEARNDRVYQWTMSLARKLLRAETISKAQYNKF